MKKTSSFIKNLNPKQALSIAILVVVVFVIIYFSYQKIVSTIQTAVAKKKQENENSQYGATTLSSSQIASLASQIYNAFKFNILWNWGTDEKAVENVLSQLSNNADYAALSVAYAGINKDSACPTLDSRLAYEGTDSEKRKWRGILDAKGINIYTF